MKQREENVVLQAKKEKLPQLGVEPRSRQCECRVLTAIRLGR